MSEKFLSGQCYFVPVTFTGTKVFYSVGDMPDRPPGRSTVSEKFLSGQCYFVPVTFTGTKVNFFFPGTTFFRRRLNFQAVPAVDFPGVVEKIF